MKRCQQTPYLCLQKTLHTWARDKIHIFRSNDEVAWSSRSPVLSLGLDTFRVSVCTVCDLGLLVLRIIVLNSISLLIIQLTMLSVLQNHHVWCSRINLWRLFSSLPEIRLPQMPRATVSASAMRQSASQPPAHTSSYDTVRTLSHAATMAPA